MSNHPSDCPAAPPNLSGDKWEGEHKKALADVLDTIQRGFAEIGPERLLRAITQLRQDATVVKALEVSYDELSDLLQFADDIRQEYPLKAGVIERLVVAYQEMERTMGDVQAGCDLVRGGRLYRQTFVKDLEEAERKTLTRMEEIKQTNKSPESQIP